jgi:8-oxo-dGTP pyrophosphatase MutT (NUDIX family)
VYVNQRDRSNVCGDPAVFARDLRAEGEPEREFNPGIAEKLPRKNVASGALIRNEKNEILFVVPSYKPFLEIPGGLVEDDESPLAACRRELMEELGVEIFASRLLLIDWMPTQGVWRDSIQLIFDGGLMTSDQIEAIKPAQDEISHYEFLTLEQARTRLRPSMARRIELAMNALEHGAPQYAEFGRLPPANGA